MLPVSNAKKMHGPSLFGKSASVYVVESLETTDILPGAFERAERREAIARCNKTNSKRCVFED